MLSETELQRLADEIFAVIVNDFDVTLINSFSELHDLTDANKYLEREELWNDGVLDTESANAILEIIDNRLKIG